MPEQEIKRKKKKWIPIMGSREFGQFEIGETFTEDPTRCIGRTIKVNLMTLTRDPKRQSDNIIFKITEFKDSKLHTELLGSEIISAHLKRFAKRAKRKIEDSFTSTTKDKIEFRIKPVLLLRTKTCKSTLKNLRKSTRDFIADYASKNTYSQIMRSVTSNILQKEMKHNLKKIYPVTSCLIKNIKRT